MDFDIFGRNVTDKVGNQKSFTMPPQIACASALPGKTGKHENAPVRYLPERKKCHL